MKDINFYIYAAIFLIAVGFYIHGLENDLKSIRHRLKKLEEK